MIQPTSANPSAANFKLPSVIKASEATVEVFGQVYTANTTQFATRETAEKLAELLGGRVSDYSEQWGLGRISPLYHIEMPGGISLNAGLLADRFQRYGTQEALRMTQDELGVRPPILASERSLHPATISQAAVVAGAAGKSETGHAASAAASEKFNADIEKSKLAEAAKKFEALLLAQILKSATPEDGESLLSGAGDSSSQSIYQLALENFASVLSLQGGLGLADSVATQLKSHGFSTSIRG